VVKKRKTKRPLGSTTLILLGREKKVRGVVGTEERSLRGVQRPMTTKTCAEIKGGNRQREMKRRTNLPERYRARSRKTLERKKEHQGIYQP